MFSNRLKPQKPEDMLLRVIRVAEILVKAHDKSSANMADNSPRLRETTQNLVQKRKTDVSV